MHKTPISLLLGALALAATPESLDADHRASPAVLVELFTSQGCSSCPPADHLLAQLASEEPSDGVEVIPLAFHVDYWNHLGWRDPFSSEAWSKRQRAYAAAMRLETVYTPQLILNGRRQLVGSDEREVRRAIRQEAGPGPPVALDLRVLEITDDGSVRVEVGASAPEGSLGQRFLGMLALYQNRLVTPVSRGENARRTLENARVVRSLRAVLELASGQAKATREEVELRLDRDWPIEDLGLVLFLQNARSLEVLGATAIRSLQ